MLGTPSVNLFNYKQYIYIVSLVLFFAKKIRYVYLSNKLLSHFFFFSFFFFVFQIDSAQSVKASTLSKRGELVFDLFERTASEIIRAMATADTRDSDHSKSQERKDKKKRRRRSYSSEHCASIIIENVLPTHGCVSRTMLDRRE